MDVDRDPLLEWNRLSRENAENAIVDSLFHTVAGYTNHVDVFVTWLLAGAAAVASFLIANLDKVVPFLADGGFKTCGAFLIASCVFGLLSKSSGLQCKMSAEGNLKIQDIIKAALAKHEITEQEILKYAAASGVEVDTGVRMERVLSEYLKPFPVFVKWLTMRHLKSNAGNPQMGHLIPLKAFIRQGVFMSFQVLSFLGFIAAGFLFVK